MTVNVTLGPLQLTTRINNRKLSYEKMYANDTKCTNRSSLYLYIYSLRIML